MPSDGDILNMYFIIGLGLACGWFSVKLTLNFLNHTIGLLPDGYDRKKSKSHTTPTKGVKGAVLRVISDLKDCLWV